MTISQLLLQGLSSAAPTIFLQRPARHRVTPRSRILGPLRTSSSAVFFLCSCLHVRVRQRHKGECLLTVFFFLPSASCLVIGTGNVVTSSLVYLFDSWRLDFNVGFVNSKLNRLSLVTLDLPTTASCANKLKATI